MIVVFCFWIILLLTFSAFGDALLLIYNRITKEENVLSFINLFFVGICIGGAIACSLSLFIPLTTNVFLAILLFTIVYWVLRRKALTTLVKDIYIKYKDLSLVGKIFSFLTGLIVLYHSSLFSTSFDEFLYHLQSIGWMQEYGVVKGLANLHLRFGFNSSAMSIFGLFTYHPDIRISFTALNGLCLLVLSLWLVYKAFSCKNIVKSLMFVITLVVFVHFYGMELSSTSTDIMVNIFVTYVLLNCLLVKNGSASLLFLVIMPVTCVTLKLSSAPIVIVSLYLFWQLLKEKKYSNFGFIAGIAGIISISWLIQNVLLTGYLIFPFSGIDIFSFDWKVPVNIVSHEQEVTYNWARGLSEVEAINSNAINWIPNWFVKSPLIAKIVYIPAALSILLFGFTYKKINKERLVVVGYFTAIAGSIFGFMTAPALRFSLGFVLVTAFIAIIYACQNDDKKTKIGLTLKIGLLTLFALFHFNLMRIKVEEIVNMESSYAKALFIKPFPVSYARGNMEFEKMEMSNFELYVPSRGDQCYDEPLPCSPFALNNIELRGKSLQDGFRIKQNN